jgi:LysM repeat protein
MKAFTVLFLLFFLFVIFSASSLSDLDLTPYNGPVVQGAQQQSPAIPLAPTPGVSSLIPLEAQAQTAAALVEVQVPASGIPVTGGTLPATSIPVAGNCGVQYIPVTGGCGVTYVPVTGVPVTGIPVTASCSNPYVVYYGDTLSRIARACGSTVSAILALNPGITNANLIYPGQVLWIYAVTSAPSVPVTGINASPTVTVPINPIVLNPSIVPIPSRTSLHVSVNNFPPQTPVNIGIGRLGLGYQVINTAITDANGVLRTTAMVPDSNDTQQQWVIIVVTTTTPLVKSISAPFYITPAQ